MLTGLDLTKLVDRLNPTCRRALETAAAMCVTHGADQVTHEHLLLGLLESSTSDLVCILRTCDFSPELLAMDIRRTTPPGHGGGGRPVFSSSLIDVLQEAWLISSVELGADTIRSGAVLLALLSHPLRLGGGTALEGLSRLSLTDIKARFVELTRDSAETADVGKADGRSAVTAPEGSALAKYTVDFTGKARAGDIDPVFCRDREIRQIVDILGRRRKNNPICVGDAGVGKTAVVEGLALKVVHGDVPDFLRDVAIHGLDMGLLQAGASVKGEFENRLKSVIQEVKASVRPVILFIDEAHTLIGAGGPQGGGDAANLLKPVLARGELRTIAATTWSEYKKYFEKDPALARRFQLVKLDEPSPSEAATIIRGLRPAYEKVHGVYIRDDAVIAAAELSARYISGRQLPDKAIDVLDTACARVHLSLSGKPKEVDEWERRIATLEREREALARDRQFGVSADTGRSTDIADRIAAAQEELAAAQDRWEREKDLVERVLAARQAMHRAEVAEMEGEGGAEEAPDPLQGDPVEALRRAQADLDTVTGGRPLVRYEVCPETIGSVISDWTGIPLGRMVHDESSLLRGLGDLLRERIRGQDDALSTIHNGVMAAKAQLQSPTRPLGVFLLAGPSGVGKTETALALADVLFGGERFMTTVNMSEFQEKHSVSRLIGSPPGYVGFGEGGVLTEAVRQRPYSVVLLDEIEKADPEVLNLFYQVFDKGTLSDGEGRDVDFRNTIILMTTNLASAELTDLAERGVTERDALVKSISPVLMRWLKPALLGRMTVVPYLPLSETVLADVVRMKLDALGERVAARHRIGFSYDAEVVDALVARCANVDTGARAVDHILHDGLMPRLAGELLARMGEREMPERLSVGLADDGGFALTFDERALPVEITAA